MAVIDLLQTSCWLDKLKASCFDGFVWWIWHSGESMDKGQLKRFEALLYYHINPYCCTRLNTWQSWHPCKARLMSAHLVGIAYGRTTDLVFVLVNIYTDVATTRMNMVPGNAQGNCVDCMCTVNYCGYLHCQGGMFLLKGCTILVIIHCNRKYYNDEAT